MPSCDCAQREMDEMERYFDRQIDQLETRIERLRQALRDAGVAPALLSKIEAGQ